MAKDDGFDDEQGREQVARRRDETIRRMFATPPTPHKPLGKKKKAPRRQPSSPKGKRGS